ncbi:hypothetical protein AHF37_06057 [Paragonimus kellicotti]|nr:hypothetical protein AHF37_06057 [Paragonimus kellicotti]
MFHPGHSAINDDFSASASTMSDETNTKPSKRAYLIQELVTTQLQFATDLTQLNTVLNNVSVKLKDEDRQALLVNLPQIAQVSMELYKCWNQELLKYPSAKCEDAHIDECWLFWLTIVRRLTLLLNALSEFAQR